MIKFGIPSIRKSNEQFPDQMVLTVHRVEASKAKRRFSLSRAAATALKIIPGISQVGFSFEDGNYIADITRAEGVANADKLLVTKELSFTSKKAHEFVCSHFSLSEEMDNHLPITSVEDMSGLLVGTFSGTPLTPTAAPVEESVEFNILTHGTV